MPRITPISFQKLIKVFLEIGWEYKKKKATHHILTCPNCKKPVVIPEYNEIDVDIIKNNLRTVGLSKEEYLEILKRV